MCAGFFILKLFGTKTCSSKITMGLILQLMLMFGDYEARDSLSHMNIRAPRLIWLSVPPLQVEKEGGWVRWVIEQPDTHSNLAL